MHRGFGAKGWHERWAAGRIIGINERLPFGYFRAADYGCDIRYSEDKTRIRAGQLLVDRLMSLTPIDIAHAWRNRDGIYASDVVWTFTEAQYLAILLLFE